MTQIWNEEHNADIKSKIFLKLGSP